MIKSTPIPSISRSSFSESEGDQKPPSSSAHAEAKPELTTAPKPVPVKHFYALYSLKLNRVSKESSPKQKPASTILQLLDREATLNKDFSLTLICNSLDPRNESYLRECLAKKIEKGAFYASANSGNISAFNLGFDRDGNSPVHSAESSSDGESKENKTAGQIESICYYFLYRPTSQPNNEFLICFILHSSDYNLDLFRNELDYYIESCVQTHLNDGDLKQMAQLEASLRNWYQYSVNYLPRTLCLFKDNLAVFIDQILANGGVSYESFEKILRHVPEEDKSDEDVFSCDQVTEFCQLDLELFYTSLFCTYLMQSASSEPSRAKSATNGDSNLNNSSLNASVNASMSRGNEGENEALVITFNKESKTVSLSKTECSVFSKECAKTLLAELSNPRTNPFHMKQIIEACKLKLIQELNTLNRILRKAENHYYDLYKVYLYLKQSQMTDVLVKMYKSCQSSNGGGGSKSEPGLSSLMLTFNVVIDFYKQKTRSES